MRDRPKFYDHGIADAASSDPLSSGGETPLSAEEVSIVKRDADELGDLRQSTLCDSHEALRAALALARTGQQQAEAERDEADARTMQEMESHSATLKKCEDVERERLKLRKRLDRLTAALYEEPASISTLRRIWSDCVLKDDQ